MTSMSKLFGGILLIAGTSIGAGMLALPVTCAPLGFFYSTLLLLVCWLFMYLTGLLVLEVNLGLEDNASYISMARATLGPIGGFFNWLFFLLLLYSLLAAYVSGGGDIMQDLLVNRFKLNLHSDLGPLLWVVLFSIVIFFGVSVADKLNRIFMFGLIAAYAFLMTIALPKVDFHLPLNGEIKYVWAALPVLFASLAFHIIIPSLCRYLDRNESQLRKIILFGSLLPLVVYIAWEFVIFGIIPVQGEQGLLAILKSGHAASQITNSLQSILQNAWVSAASRFFVIFALASSFLGVAYGLYDLIRDGLDIESSTRGRLLGLFMTLLPPLLFALAYPAGFIFALKYSGIFVAIIHGIFPVLMAVSSRYFVKADTDYRLFGGITVLLIIALFFLVVIYCDVAVDLGLLPTV